MANTNELKKTRGLKKWCKEKGYNPEDIQKEWDKAVAEGGSTLIDWLARQGGNWDNLQTYQIEQLFGLSDRIKKSKEDARLKKEAEEKKKREEEDAEKYYEEHIEEILVAKIDKGEHLTEQEIMDFLWKCGEEIETNEGTSHRWTKDMETILKVCDRYWCVPWGKGLTEYQENYYDKQPYEVVEHSYKKTIIVKEWQRVKEKQKPIKPIAHA